MKLIEYTDSEVMMLRVAQILGEAIEEALRQHGRATLAVPGGTTPGPVFDQLCAIDLDWSQVSVMLTDERWVPESSPRSNTALLRARLLTGRAAAATLVPLYGDAAQPEDALPLLSDGVSACLPLSVCLLGMGADMHTASLFPGADQLDSALTGADPLYAMRAPGAPEPRITLSASALKSAMQCHVLIVGSEKREALERARALPPQEAPVAAILEGAHVHWAPN